MKFFLKDPVARFLMAISIVFIAVSIFAVKYENEETNRLIAQCMADGKKEYECRAMFRDNTQHAPVYIYR